MKIPIALVLAVLIVSPILVHAQDTATPDPTILLSPTATARLALTPTPIGNWVQGDPVGIIVRSGPGLRFDVLGTLANGQTIEAVGRDAELGWIMIRLGGSFGWVRRPLVYWADNLSNLPVLRIGALTPSPTFTRTTRPTGTMTPTFTLTSTPIPTLTASSTPTFAPTSTPIPTLTASSTPTFTLTSTPIPTLTNTPTFAPTSTPIPTLTNTPTFAPTSTPIPTLTNTPTFAPTDTPMPTLTNTPTFAPTDTPIPTPTDIALIMVAPLQTSLSSPTDTPTDLPSATPSLSATMVPSLTPAVTASLTYTALPIETLIPTSTATLVFTATATPTTTTSAALLVPPTGIVLVAVSVPPTGTVLVAVSVPPLLETNASEVPPRFPAEAVVGGLVLIGILSYAGVYWSGANAIERYANGFPTDDCPVCKRGSLTVETRVDRVIGVPRPRFVVTCDTCRSVLREVGGRRWRYAVDRSANPMLYTQYNGRVVAEDKLVNLSAWNQSLSEPPIFEEESS